MSSDLLLFRNEARQYASLIEHVEEVLRPLPVQAVSEMPGFVRGVAIIRGRPVPVVDLAALFGGDGARSDAGRWIVVKTGDEHRVALQVASILGVSPQQAFSVYETPPLLEEADHGVIEALGRRDGALLALLRVARLVAETAVSAPEDEGLTA